MFAYSLNILLIQCMFARAEWIDKVHTVHAMHFICKFTRVLIIRLHTIICGLKEAADPVPSGRRDMLLQLPLFMELDQLVFTILRQSVHSTREPDPLRSEHVDFCQQGLDISLRVFVILAKRIRESISVMYYVFEFLFGRSMDFDDFSHLIHRATGWKSFQSLVFGMQPRVLSSKFSICRLQQLWRVAASIALPLDPDFGCSRRFNNSINQLINLAPRQ